MKRSYKGKGNPMYGVQRFGKDNPFWGRRHTGETKERIRQFRLGREISKETRRKISIANSGENNYGWKGGKKDYHARIARKIWEEYWREEVPEGYLIHHVDRDITNNDICNLALLTPKGHLQIHKGGIPRTQEVKDKISKTKRRRNE